MFFFSVVLGFFGTVKIWIHNSEYLGQLSSYLWLIWSFTVGKFLDPVIGRPFKFCIIVACFDPSDSGTIDWFLELQRVKK